MELTQQTIKSLSTLVVISPLAGAIMAGLFGKIIGRKGAHVVTIFGVFAALLCSLPIAYSVIGGGQTFESVLYTWGVSSNLNLSIGFLIDSLTSVMMVVVTFVSLMVHIYTIGYMHDDPGYQRFFSYIAFFTFSMLMLVMSNNFLQLFFGWEAVGVASYLLIGFWFKRETAIFANLKAFLVNRIGDFGFILGIGAVLAYFGTLDYAPVFAAAPQLAADANAIVPGTNWNLVTAIGILLFIGAMGKSAQVPLHVWLPDSMEGPTPISALIHAATMVTAGVFMVARMSPLYEYSEIARSLVLVIGSITCLFMGLLGIVQQDIKRIIAYSTLSQLGYMVAALGVSAYGAAIFHLATHAFFKALLFLGAGSVIIAMHHKQNIMEMGGIRKHMPITYYTMLIGSLALMGFPFFSGFYSKELIIEAVKHSEIAGSSFAYFAVLSSVFVTAFYSFRLLFLVFHQQERMDEHTKSHLKESPWVVTIPLILLAVPSVLAGAMMEDAIFGDLFKDSITVLPQNDIVAEIGSDYHGWLQSGLHGFVALPVWLGFAGLFAAWWLYIRNPQLPGLIAHKFNFIYQMLMKKYGCDEFNQKVFAGGARSLGDICSKFIDRGIIDGAMVNGMARTVGLVAAIVRHLQSGYLYHYSFAMFVGLLALIVWLLQF